MIRALTLCVFFCVLFSAVAAAPQTPAQAPAPAPQIQPGTYEDSTAGLEKQAADIFAAIAAGQNPVLYAHARSMLLPDSAWFSRAFGDDRGAAYAAAYESRRHLMHLILGRDLSNAAGDGYTQVQALRFTEPCDPFADPRYYPALFGRLEPVALYELRMVNPEVKTARALAFFVYLDGAFRYLGGLRTSESPFAGEQRPEVRAGRLKGVETPAPQYPQLAQDGKIEGAVRLWALVGPDGTVKDLHLVEGHCWLAEAAIAAVRQWRFEPHRQGGQAVETATTIEMPFKLPAPPPGQ